jgi:hypothetical protein
VPPSLTLLLLLQQQQQQQQPDKEHAHLQAHVCMA